VDDRTSSIIHCEDRKALEQWIVYIEAHILALNRKSIRMSNKYLHPSERIRWVGYRFQKRLHTIEVRLARGKEVLSLSATLDGCKSGCQIDSLRTQR